MLSKFRTGRMATILLGVLGLVLLAMLATGVGTQSGGLSNIGSLLSGSDALAKVGNTAIEPSEVQQRVQGQVENLQQQQPDLTVKSFIAQGGLSGILNQLINGRALIAFGNAHGMAISKRAIDAKLATISAFTGLDGKFDHNKFLQALAQNHTTEAAVRSNFELQAMTEQMFTPIAGAAQMPKSMLDAYSAQFIEQHEGHFGFIQSTAMKNTPMPTESAINAFYERHAALFSLPEQRVIEYAVFHKADFANAAKPSDAEITSYYQAHASDYAAKDARGLTQVVLLDEASAQALAAKVREGTSIKEAAKAQGLEAATFAPQDKTAFAAQTSADVANAAFAAERGGVAQVAKSSLGWHVVQVDSVSHQAAKTIDQVKDDIVKTLTTSKIEDVFADFQNKVSDKASAGASFADLVKQNNGTIATTPPLTANGSVIGQPNYKTAPEMASILKDAFKADTKPSSEPLLIDYGTDKSAIALYHVRQIVPAGPIPLVSIHDQVAQAARLEAASKLAQIVAQNVVNKVNAGTELSKALSETGLQLQPMKTHTASLVDLELSKQQVPPFILAMFKVPLHHAKLIEAPAHAGWFIVWLEKKTPGDAKKYAPILPQIQQSYSKAYGQELTEEFTGAARDAVGVTRYPANIKALATSLSGGQ